MAWRGKMVVLGVLGVRFSWSCVRVLATHHNLLHFCDKETLFDDLLLDT